MGDQRFRLLHKRRGPNVGSNFLVEFVDVTAKSFHNIGVSFCDIFLLADVLAQVVQLNR